WESQISREITIQIKPDDNLDMEKSLTQARDLALTFVGTKSGQIAVERTMLTPPSVRQERKAMIDITTIKALPWMLEGG
ncbi:hypothetical protein AB9F41_37885, partial [Rhizobium leguminosarum]